MSIKEQWEKSVKEEADKNKLIAELGEQNRELLFKLREALDELAKIKRMYEIKEN